MKALFLGSIGTLADTSELQRRSFNEAFADHHLDWRWDRDDYRHMLEVAGGAARIRRHAEETGADVDADAVHATKSDRFQKHLDDGAAEARPGLADLIARAQAEGVMLGLVTTTQRANVDRLLAALVIPSSAFDVVISREDVSAAKPAPDCYHLAAASIATAPEDCLVIEDNVDGVRAATAAGMTCLAWPNANTEGHDFGDAPRVRGHVAQTVFSNRVAAE